jgi:fucose permease
LSDERAGLFFTLQFCGNLLGVAFLGILLSWRGYRTTLTAGYALIGLGVAGLALGRERLALPATAVFGIGLGLALSGSNLWVTEIFPKRRAAALSILNVAWGAGAIACPPLVLFAQRAHRLGPLLYCVACLAALVALGLATLDIEPRAEKSAAATSVRPAIGKRTVLALSGLFFLYVGVESSVGGWGAAFAKRVGAHAGSPWELAPMFFWAGLVAGRILVSAILPRISERAFLIGGLLLAGASDVALLSVTGFRAAMLCLVATGLGLACVYPLIVAWMVGYFGGQARLRSNMLFGLGCLGGATMPWLVGFISTHTASLRAGLLAPLAACLAMLGLQFLLRKPVSASVPD